MADGAKDIVRAIEDNTRKLEKVVRAIETIGKKDRPKITQHNYGPAYPEVVHRPRYSDGYVFAAACDDKVFVDNEELTVSLNEKLINCPSCKTPEISN